MKKNYCNKFFLLVLSLITLISSCAFGFVGCANKKFKIKNYPEIKKEFAIKQNFNLPLSKNDSPFFTNPDRGFRGELYITLGRNEAFPESGETYSERLDAQLEKFEQDDVKLYQCYVYLYEYSNKEIPQTALDQLKEYFELLKSKNIKILLRFAYEYTESGKIGPRTKDIVTHCKQLKEFFNKNIDLYNDIVYATQLGMIGLWGEGHGNVHNLNKKTIIKSVADMYPEHTIIMVRTPELLSLVPEELEYRFSLHDDFIVGFDHKWGMIPYDDPAYPLLLKKCQHTICDGEMPWGRGNEKGTTPEGVLYQCINYGLTSLSLEHNYTEDKGNYYLKQWQNCYFDKSFFTNKKYPLNENLLNNDGKISVFDYLKHHLGYQLVVSNVELNKNKLSFVINNFGLAKPYGYSLNIYVNGKKIELNNQFNANTLTQFGQQKISFDYYAGDIEIELIKTVNNKDRIKFYNDIPFENGKNILSEDLLNKILR